MHDDTNGVDRIASAARPGSLPPRVSTLVLTAICGVALDLLLAPPAARALDVVPTAIEVTQAVQDLSNSVPLVSGKIAHVRVHAQVTGAVSTPGVSATLSGSRLLPGFPYLLPLGTLTPANPGGQITVQSAPDRAEVNESFLFHLPPSWRTDTVLLTAQVDSNGSVAESNEENNTLSTTVSFSPMPPLRLRLYRVCYPEGASTVCPVFTDLVRLVSWLLRAYPISDMELQIRRTDFAIDLPNDLCLGGTCANDPGVSCVWDSDCGCGVVNARLLLLRMFEALFSVLPFGSNSFHPAKRYYGLVHDAGGFMRGCAVDIPSKVASGPTGPPTVDFASWDDDGSYGDWYAGHELAHTFDRLHWECCGAVGGISPPYPSCSISPADDSLYGFDYRDHAVYADPPWRDLMSYCDFQWVSDRTYEGLRDRLLLEEAAAGGGTGASVGALLVVQGTADLDASRATLGDVYAVSSQMSPPTDSMPGNFAIRLFDQADNVIGEHFFSPHPAVDESKLIPPDEEVSSEEVPSVGAIFEVIPNQPGIARIGVFHGEVELATRRATPNPPVAEVLFPNGGETLSERVTVSWKAEDPDGGPLTASLLLTCDGGMSWTGVASGIGGTSLEVDLTELPGGLECLFRVLVSDGFHTAEDTSDGRFQITDNPPFVLILNPADGSGYLLGQTVSLEAFATDPEDGMLADEGLLWSSDLQGTLGAGRRLEVADLLPGNHLVMVEATDSAGGVATETVRIEVTDPCERLGGDTDGDGICDDGDGSGMPGDRRCSCVDDPLRIPCTQGCDDNCPNVPNADQHDTDGNQVGDPCQCGDVNGDGITNVTDALKIARGEVLSADPNFDRCDVSGDQICNVTDALKIARGEIGSDPAAQLCPAYQPGR